MYPVIKRTKFYIHKNTDKIVLKHRKMNSSKL